MADLEVGEPTHPRAGGESNQPVATHVFEAQMGALVGSSLNIVARITLGYEVGPSQSAGLNGVRSVLELAVSVVGRGRVAREL